MNNSAKFAEVSRLAGLVCDDAIADIELSRLDALLLNDSSAQFLYLRHLELDNKLKWRSHEVSFVSRLASGETLPGPTDALLKGIPNQQQPLRFSWRLHSLAASIMVVAALFYSAFALIAWNLRPANPLVATDDKENTSPRENAQSDPNHTVARLTGSHQARWLNDTLTVEERLSAARPFTLVAGTAEVTFDNGATVKIIGPSTFELCDTKSGRLTLGKIIAHVPPRAVGFTLSTPLATIVDRGTDFGVEVNERGEAEIHTFTGVVDVMRAEKAIHGSSNTRQLIAGEAMRVTSSHISKAEFRSPDDFSKLRKPVTQTRDATQEERSRNYAELLLHERPILYFSMDELEGEHVLDSGPGHHHGELRGRLGRDEPLAPGMVGQALRLHGPGVRDHVMITDYPASKSGKLSVVAWVLVRSSSYASSIAKNWGAHDVPSGQFHFGLSADTRRLAVEVRQANQEVVFLAEPREFPVPLDHWQHVAFVADGNHLHLYRNGVEVATTQCEEVLATPDLSVLGIGVKPLGLVGTDDKPDQSNPGYWHGLIDELAVFDQALTADLIHRLWQLSRQP